MANHAKVCTSKTLDPLEINEIVQRLNKEKLHDIFTLNFEVDTENGWGKYQWILRYKEDPCIAIEFWLSDEKEYGKEINGKWIQFKEAKILSTQSCIEFRHGHSFQFMWWVEGVFRENLGKHYNARMWDDGTSWLGPASPEKYENFQEYIESYAKDRSDKAAIKVFKNHKLPDWQLEEIPKELVEKLNLDFKI